MKDFELDRLEFVRRFREYTAVPSLSYNEKELFQQEVFTTFDHIARAAGDGSYSWTIEHKNGFLWYAFLQVFPSQGLNITAERRHRLVYVIHLDRVPNWRTGEAYSVNGYDDTEGNLHGQLDNSISLAIMAVILEQKLPVSILFTTDEEQGGSWPQLVDLQKKMPDIKFVSMDIDIFHATDKKDLPFITLRDRDRDAKFDKDLVEFLRAMAVTNNLTFTTTTGSAIVEPGMMSMHTDGKYTGAHIGLPLLNYHSDKEIMQWTVIQDAIRLVMALQTQTTQPTRTNTQTTQTTT